MDKKKITIMAAIAFVALLLGILVGISLNSFLKPDATDNKSEQTQSLAVDKPDEVITENSSESNTEAADEVSPAETKDESTATTETVETTVTNDTTPNNNVANTPVADATGKIPFNDLNGLCMADETGKYLKYEIIIDDVSWKDAFKDCVERGGHLLIINDMKEYDTISKFVFDKKADGNLFLLGGMREKKADKYYWVDSTKTPIEDNALNEEKAWCETLWAVGEPSFHDNHDNDECYMMTYYSQTEKRWLWCDVINDYTGMAPQDKGRLAYICEYE